MFFELQNGFCSFPGDGGIQEGFNKNRKLIELLLRPCHSDCPDNFSAPALSGTLPPRVLPNKFSGSQKVQATNKSLSVPPHFFQE